MLTEAAILDFLRHENAVLTGAHFIYTNGGHGTAYINMRAVAHHIWWLADIGTEMGLRLDDYSVDLVVGPETLGRTLVGFAALATKGQQGIWCTMVGEGEDKFAEFSPKFPQFAELIPNKRVGIVDDLLTTGSSMRAVADLVDQYGGNPVVGVGAVRRTPDVAAEDCGVDELEVLADVPGFAVYTEEQCADFGPCSKRVPVVLRHGHGHEWIKHHPDYPVVA